MFRIIQCERFELWLEDLKDLRAKSKIVLRIKRLAVGNPGDVKSIGGGVSELRIKTGPGYRVYFAKRGVELILLLCGGDKSSQREDILVAKRMAAELKVELNEN